MSESVRPSFLRLVHDRDAAGRPTETSGHFEPVQSSLLASGLKTLVVCTTDSLDEHSFVYLISELRPHTALDLRATPRFDFGSLNRRRALALFEGLNVQYRDLGLGMVSDDRAFEAIKAISEDPEFIEPIKGAQGTTIIVFIDPKPDYRNLGLRFVLQFRAATGFDWEVVLNGPSTHFAGQRRTLFISHATEDNEFVLWLQAQLTKQGYEVWSDLTELKGGEVFWDTIEAVIRTRAAKVLVVASRVAMTKPNVLDEISLAVSIERAEQNSGFVIPLRIDDLPFMEFRANIARKNAIDYSRGWSRGLFKLLETLKRDGVQCVHQSGPTELAVWWERRKAARSRIVREPETLISNQYSVDAVPSKLFLLTGSPINDDDMRLDLFGNAPLVPYQGNWLSFLSDRELADTGLKGLTRHTTAATTEVLNGNVSFVSRMAPRERQRLLHWILNRHWEWYLSKKGLSTNEANNRTAVMYFPRGLLPKDQAEFIDVDNALHRRKLVGYSEKRKMYWHLGLSGRFGGDTEFVMKLRVSVVFTEDGLSNAVQGERTNELRRRFCKNWWNDKWRSLQTAAMTWLAGNSKSMIIHEGESGRVVVSSQARTYVVPLGIREERAHSAIDIDLDETDIPENSSDWSDFEDEMEIELGVQHEEP